MEKTDLRRPFNWRVVSWLLAGMGLLAVIGANVHLVRVATGSQPECVDHLKAEGRDGTYRAAASLNGQPLQISLMGPGVTEDYASSVTHDFTMGWLENQFRVMAKP